MIEKKCQKCGNDLGESDAFCRICGTRHEQAIQKQHLQEEANVDKNVAFDDALQAEGAELERQNAEKKKKKILTILLYTLIPTVMIPILALSIFWGVNYYESPAFIWQSTDQKVTTILQREGIYNSGYDMYSIYDNYYNDGYEYFYMLTYDEPYGDIVLSCSVESGSLSFETYLNLDGDGYFKYFSFYIYETGTEEEVVYGYGDIYPPTFMSSSVALFDYLYNPYELSYSSILSVACTNMQLSILDMELTLDDFNFSFSEYGFVME